MLSATLDATDWKILDRLQGDARIANVKLAEAVNLSPSPCLYRHKHRTASLQKSVCFTRPTARRHMLRIAPFSREVSTRRDPWLWR